MSLSAPVLHSIAAAYPGRSSRILAEAETAYSPSGLVGLRACPDGLQGVSTWCRHTWSTLLSASMLVAPPVHAFSVTLERSRRCTLCIHLGRRSTFGCSHVTLSCEPTSPCSAYAASLIPSRAPSSHRVTSKGRSCLFPSPNETMPVIDKLKDALRSNADAASSSAAERDAEREAKGAPVLPATPAASATPVFDSRKVTVIFVLGGPGVGEADLLRPRPLLT